MIRLNEIKMPLGTTELEVKKEASKILHIKESDIKDFSLARRSIDSRKKDNIFLVYSANIETDLNEENLIAGFLPNKAFLTQKFSYKTPEICDDESVKAFGETLAIASEVTMRNFCLRRGLHYGAAIHGRLIFCVMHLNNSKLLHK